MKRTRVITLVGLAAMMLALTACERKITRVENASTAQACTDCHVSDDLITGNISAKFDYLYMNFSEELYTPGGDIEPDLHTFRLGVNYKF